MTIASDAHPVLRNAEKILQAHRDITRALNEKLRETGLTMSDCRVLGILRSHSGSPLSVDQVARRADLHRTSVGATLERLESFGLVTRERPEHDLRRVDVALTAYGASRLAASEAVLETFTPSGLPPEVRALWSLATADGRPRVRTPWRG